MCPLVQVEVQDLNGEGRDGVGEGRGSVTDACDDRDNTCWIGDGVGLLRCLAAQRGDGGFAVDVGSSGQVDLYRLRSRCGVDELEDQVVGLRVVGDGVEEAGAFGIQICFEHLIAEIGAEHNLHVVAGRAVAVQGVVADEVAGPLHAAGVDVGEDGSVGGHDDEVAVALEAGHPGGVAEGCAEVGGGGSFTRGPFADEDFRAVTVGVVVAVRVGEELLRATVEVIIDHIGSDGFDRSRGDELKFRVPLLDGLVELRVTAVIGAGFVELVLVTDFNVGEMKGSRVAVFGAFRTPLGGGASGHVLDLIEGILNVGLEVGAGVYVLLVEGVSGVYSEERVHVEVLAPLQEFEETHAVGGLITPRAGVRGTVDERAKGLLPLEALVDVVAFKVVAAGEAKEGGVHGSELLHEVDAVAVGGVVVGWGEEGDEREPGGTGVVEENFEMVCGRQDERTGLEVEVVLVPVGGEGRDGGGGVDGSGVVVDETDGDGPDSVAVGFGVEGAMVGGVWMERHAPVAVVEKAGGGVGAGCVDGELEAACEGGAGPSGLVGSDVGVCVAVLEEGPVADAAPIGQEGAIVDEFGVEAAVVGVVDLFGHEAIEGGADLGDGLGGVDAERGRTLCDGDERNGGEEDCSE